MVHNMDLLADVLAGDCCGPAGGFAGLCRRSGKDICLHGPPEGEEGRAWLPSMRKSFPSKRNPR